MISQVYILYWEQLQLRSPNHCYEFYNYLFQEVVEVETTSTTSPHVPDAKEKLAVSVKQEQKDEEEAGEENKIIVVDDEGMFQLWM